MKKTLWVIALAAMLITACASATPQAAVAQPSAAGKPISTEFTPTDPKTVKLAAGQVQFVEFFAFW